MTFATNRNPPKPRLSRYHDWFHPDGKVPAPSPGTRSAGIQAALATPEEQLRTEQNRYYALKRETNLPFIDAAIIERCLVSTCTPLINSTSVSSGGGKSPTKGKESAKSGSYASGSIKERRQQQQAPNRRRLPSLTPMGSGTPSSPPSQQTDLNGSHQPPPPNAPGTVFIPTLPMLRTLNAHLQQQADLAHLLCSKYIARRDAIVHVIRTETCCAALGMMNRGMNTNQRDVLVSTSMALDGDGVLSDCSVLSAQSGPLSDDGLSDITSQASRQQQQRTSGGGTHCSAASHRRLAALIQQLDLATDDVVTLILLWRRNLSKPVPFLWSEENYLLKIRKEIDTVVGPAHRHMMKRAKERAASEKRSRDSENNGAASINPSDFGTVNTTDESPDDSEFYQSYYLSRVSRRDVLRRASHSVRIQMKLEDKDFEERSKQRGESTQNRIGPQNQDSVEVESVLTDIYPGALLISTVFRETDTQEAYLKEMQLRTAQGKYSFLNRTYFVPSNPFQPTSYVPPTNHAQSTTVTTTTTSSKKSGSSDPAASVWFQFPVEISVKSMPDDPSGTRSTLACSTSRASGKYHTVVLVDELGHVPLGYMKHIFRPKAAKQVHHQPQPKPLYSHVAQSTEERSTASTYGDDFNVNITNWLSHCFKEGMANLESYFDDAFAMGDTETDTEDGEEGDEYVEEEGNVENLTVTLQLTRKKRRASVQESFDLTESQQKTLTPEEQRARRLRKMEHRQHHRLRYHFFQKWVGLSLVRAERKKLMYTLVRRSDRTTRGRRFADWKLWMNRRRKRHLIVQQLLTITEKCHLAQRLLSWRSFVTLTRFGRTIQRRIFDPSFQKLYRYVMIRRLSKRFQDAERNKKQKQLAAAKELSKEKTSESSQSFSGAVEGNDDTENNDKDRGDDVVTIPLPKRMSPLMVPPAQVPVGKKGPQGEMRSSHLASLFAVVFSRPSDLSRYEVYRRVEKEQLDQPMEESAQFREAWDRQEEADAASNSHDAPGGRESPHFEGDSSTRSLRSSRRDKNVEYRGIVATTITQRHFHLRRQQELEARKSEAPPNYYMLKMYQYALLQQQREAREDKVDEFKRLRKSISM